MIYLRQRFQTLASKLPKLVPKRACHTASAFKLHAPDALYNESFMNGTNAIFIENLYANWLKNRTSVPASWNAYFTNITKNLASQDAFELPATISNQGGITIGAGIKAAALVPVDKVIESIRVCQLIQAYRRRGHEVAHLDPLGTLH
jgi:2-oxoglutarate dehydrogenase E1 component